MVPIHETITLQENQALQVDLPQMTVLTQQDLDQAVQSAIDAWDANGDGTIGLEDIIYWLQVLTGVRSP